MLIDELNECEGRVRVAEAVIGDLKKSGLGGIGEYRGWLGGIGVVLEDL